MDAKIHLEQKFVKLIFSLFFGIWRVSLTISRRESFTLLVLLRHKFFLTVIFVFFILWKCQIRQGENFCSKILVFEFKHSEHLKLERYICVPFTTKRLIQNKLLGQFLKLLMFLNMKAFSFFCRSHFIFKYSFRMKVREVR